MKNIGHITITEFEKSIQIKDFLSKQWADMFKLYLTSLRESKNTEQLHTMMSNMQSLLSKMEIMLDGVGKKVIAKDENVTYDEIVKKQELIINAKSIVDIIVDCTEVFYDDEVVDYEEVHDRDSNVAFLLEWLKYMVSKATTDNDGSVIYLNIGHCDEFGRVAYINDDEIFLQNIQSLELLFADKQLYERVEELLKQDDNYLEIFEF